ncbi:hypothetical protein RHSIM_Rhsim04G0168400 [Rhododendron simsii]|uniref:Non-haem dioxygenase N-terminal domain-containing protein n=1 Tax=Rhododendron simsii TaxID=118357 RepID=A0A834HET5_RHOSS|nr:hypothetical protein RHSIM_Rhsim04G0168400 [Rhododendron simsii]
MEISGEEHQQHTRVQSLAQNCKVQMPQQYVQLPEHRPNNAAAVKSVPIIDLSGSRTKVREEVGQACREWGAFHVSNHGFPIQLLDDMRRVGLNFFEDCPMTDKLTYSCDSSISFAAQGYGSRMLVSDDSVLDWRDYFDHHTLPLSRRDSSRWPHFPPNYSSVRGAGGWKIYVGRQRELGTDKESLGSLDLKSNPQDSDLVGEHSDHVGDEDEGCSEIDEARDLEVNGKSADSALEVHAIDSTIRSVQGDVEAAYGKSEVWQLYEVWFGKLSEMPHFDYKNITAANMRPKSNKSKRIKISQKQPWK